MLDTTELLRLIETNYHKPYNRRVWNPRELYEKEPKDFDCSSFTMWLFFQLGFKLPRVSQDQYTFCDKITWRETKVGDLFFLGKGMDPKQVNHVGIYKGSGIVAEAVGGKTGKVIYSDSQKTMARPDWVGWGRVPLELAEDRFFKWIANNPKE